MTNPIRSLLSYIRDWRDRRALVRERANAPTTLAEAVDRIIATMTEDDKAAYRAQPAESPGAIFHHFGGMAMRNAWDLWSHDSFLCQWLSGRGFFNGDDRSALIYKAVWCHLNHIPLRIEEEAERNRLHWATYGVNPDGTPIPGSTAPAATTTQVIEVARKPAAKRRPAKGKSTRRRSR